MGNARTVDKREVRRELLGFDERARRHACFLDSGFLDSSFLGHSFLDSSFLDNLLYMETPAPTTLRR